MQIQLTESGRAYLADQHPRAGLPAWFRHNPTDAQRVDRALALLIAARELLKAADNKRTAARVRAAISSCKGARRIQDYRSTRAQRAARP